MQKKIHAHADENLFRIAQDEKINPRLGDLEMLLGGSVSPLTLGPETGMSIAECIRRATVPLRARDPLAAEHGGTWEEPVVAGDRVLVAVEEFEISPPAVRAAPRRRSHLH